QIYKLKLFFWRIHKTIIEKMHSFNTHTEVIVQKKLINRFNT
ncbi:hypothetical protein LCGC14_2797620, partial [marine sediment metagenome]